MTDHESASHTLREQLFKELLSTFFIEFLELFLPDVAATIALDSVRFLPQEYFADLTSGEEKIIDLLVEVKQSGQDAAVLVHIEAQSFSEANFTRRMFFYFARLHQKYLQRIYPIVVFSFDEPQRAEADTYTVEFPDRKVLEFNFASIQLNRLNWRDYLNQRNPVAAALMSKMRIAPEDRPQVKAECLRALATLSLNPARTRLIARFVDTYLRLTGFEEQMFQAEIDKMEPAQREGIMQITTSWEEKGLAQGRQEGRQSLVLLLLEQRIGRLSNEVRDRVSGLSLEQLEGLAIALLRFQAITDLETWLAENG